MKKLLFIFFTLLSLYSMGQGTFTANGDLAPTGSYPITRFGSAQTGYWPLTHLTDRDAIPTWQRTYGMMVYVKDADSTYTLKSATLDNSNWVAFKQGSVDVTNLMKYGDTASLSNRIDLKLNKTDTATLSDRINQRVSYTDSNTTFITLKQLRDSLATISSGSSGISLNVDRPITRTSLGLNGQNLGSGGKTVAQFLDAFFFPALAATPPTTTLTYNSSTNPVTIPYSTWKGWPSGPNFTTSVNLDWSLINKSKLDGTDDKNITSIDLMTGGSSIRNVLPDNSGTTQSGTFSAVPFTKTGGDPTTSYNQTYTLQVVDAQPNTVTSSNITFTASAANRLTVSGLTLTPNVTSNIYEYRAIDTVLSLAWGVTKNDETTIVSQTINTTTVASSPQNVPFLVANPTTTYTVKVVGNLYASGATASITASWAKRLYCGVFTSALPPDDGSFAFTSAQTINLPSTQLGGDWRSTNGANFTFDGSGNQYLVFAYPEDGKVGEIDALSTVTNSWNQYDAKNNVKQYTQTFVNQFGYSSTYRYVFLTMSYKSATLQIRLQ